MGGAEVLTSKEHQGAFAVGDGSVSYYGYRGGHRTVPTFQYNIVYLKSAVHF
jgi:hypothetical protein